MQNRFKMKTNTLFLLWLAVVLVSLSACSGSSSDKPDEAPPAPPPPPTLVSSITPILDAGLKSTESIGPGGGSVIVTDANGVLYTLDFAPGTLAENVDISMTPVIDIPDLDFADRFVVGVQFEPEGIQFAQPPMLSIELPNDIAAGDLLGFGWEGPGEGVYARSINPVAGQIRIPMSHFSGAGIGVGSADEALEQVIYDEDLTAKFSARLGVEEQRIIRQICGNRDLLTCTDDTSLDFYNRFRQMMEAATLPLLTAWLSDIHPDIGGDPNNTNAREVTKSYYSWLHAAIVGLCGAEAVFCDAFDDNFLGFQESFRQHVAQGLVDEFGRAKAECNDLRVLEFNGYIGFAEAPRPWGVADLLRDLLGAEEDADVFEAIRNQFACNLVIEAIGFPESLLVGEDPDFFDLQLRNRADVLGTSLAEINVRFTMDSLNCGEVFGTSAGGIVNENTDATGRIRNIPIAALETCPESLNEVVITVAVENSVEAEETDQFFLGKNVTFSAEKIDPCAELANQFNSVLRSAVDCEGVVMTVTPSNVNLEPGETQQFTATVTGASDTSVTWSATGGTIDSGGLYTAGNVDGTFTVTAVSNADSSISDSATIEIETPGQLVTVSVDPPTVDLSKNDTVQFTATVTGATDTSVTWSASGGSITQSGLYTATGPDGRYTVTATSNADPKVSDQASVTIGTSLPADVSGRYEATGDVYTLFRGRESLLRSDEPVTIVIDQQGGLEIDVSAPSGFIEANKYRGTRDDAVLQAISDDCDSRPGNECPFDATMSVETRAGATGVLITGRFFEDDPDDADLLGGTGSRFVDFEIFYVPE